MPSRFLCTGHRVRCSASNWCWGPAYRLLGYYRVGDTGILGYWDTGMRDKWIEDLVQGSGRGVFGGLTFGGWRLSGLEGPGVWGAAGLGSGGLESAKSSP